jgi:hypothetical protein
VNTEKKRPRPKESTKKKLNSNLQLWLWIMAAHTVVGRYFHSPKIKRKHEAIVSTAKLECRREFFLFFMIYVESWESYRGKSPKFQELHIVRLCSEPKCVLEPSQRVSGH